jgi:hypothetical protein
MLPPYLRDLYEAFDGDITMAIVLGEIGQASVSPLVNAIYPDAVGLEMADGAQRQSCREDMFCGPTVGSHGCW